MSSANVDTTVQPTGDTDTPAITVEDKGNQPASSPERPFKLCNIPNIATTKHEWNGDPMDWKSWPTGRPGPFVSDGRIQHVMNVFQGYDQDRSDLSQPEEKVFHVAEFSSVGGGEFDIYHTESE
jgi:hypothetical protein